MSASGDSYSTAAASTVSAEKYGDTDVTADSLLLTLLALTDGSFHEPVKLVVKELSKLFEQHKVCASHGTVHAIYVARHAARALQVCTHKKTEKQALAVIIAALLHDADDRKFFPAHKDYQNARRIVGLANLDAEVEKLVVMMIGFVSASTNGNSVPDVAAQSPWILYPRFADRIEAIGWVGIERCWEYTLTAGRPLFVKETPRVRSEKELWDIAVPRFAAYKGDSVSMVDHWLDKLVHIGKFQTDNKYFADEVGRRDNALIEACILFGDTGKLPSFEEVKVNAKKEAASRGQ